MKETSSPRKTGHLLVAKLPRYLSEPRILLEYASFARGTKKKKERKKEEKVYTVTASH